MVDKAELDVYFKGLTKDAEIHKADAEITLDSGKKLQVFFNQEQEDGSLRHQHDPFLVLVLPGGGYEFTSYREANVVAKAFVKQGFAAAVLNYTTKTLEEVALTGQGLGYDALTDVAMAIDELRHNDTLKFENYKIIVCGFSAGGHLAASISTKYGDDYLLKMRPWRGSLRPDAAILCYPVICSDPTICHKGSFTVLTGAQEQSQWDKWSCDKLIDANTPPAFLWHTADDPFVNCQNSIRYAQAMWQCSNTAMLTIYPKGEHGASLATKEVEFTHDFRLADELIAKWLDNACTFIRQYVK